MFGSFRRRRAPRARTTCDAARETAAKGARPGPPAVAAAREYFWDRDAISFDPLETVFVRDGAGVRVRAWVHIPPDRLSPADRVSIDLSARAFADEPLLARIFFLSTSYGLSIRDIAPLLDIGPGAARRLLVRAIACLDAARLGDVGDAERQE
ncbi:hypothetical protein HL653_17670 [Sphingomonas sp. AP4-R1]|uniref:hypothetical protein n=1 Tax=Sphingomonas sp. AP4-R1 TaxID=2735134 RepID=UPI001493C928|nr:hypothetical protein [Sphingomonas sp. AP4-R1]QJU59344.1 hypothetical protein HL653_17670 [Sphingomonas sp. AP4-R1]